MNLLKYNQILAIIIFSFVAIKLTLAPEIVAGYWMLDA
jgi:hypothetical protein